MSLRVLVTGGHGFVGSLLVAELRRRGQLRGEPIGEVVVLDRVSRPVDEGAGGVPVRTVEGDLLDRMAEAFARPVDVVFHLAAALSSECEADLDAGVRTNIGGTWAVLEAARSQAEAGGLRAQVVFASSVAVYGSDPALPLPAVVAESTPTMPQSSYGAQKLGGELVIADYTRRGLVDGRVIRLMTVAVRPGAPNAAASSFVSAIVREPLAGRECVCPVAPDLQLAIASPEATVDGILAVAEAPRGDGRGELSGRLPVNLPALTVSVGGLLDALARIGGPEARALVRVEPDPAIDAIVRSWPARFDDARARALRAPRDSGVDAIVEQYAARWAPHTLTRPTTR